METAANRGRECWRCGAETATAVACPRCQAIQRLDRDVDLFAVLGLPRRLPIDLAVLERRYHDASRIVHPDRHQTASAEERDLSLAASTAVNRAYRTLRDPVARARYWLELHGEPLAENGARVPPEIAAEVFETQERLAELRAAGPGADALRADLRDVRDRLASRLGALRRDLEGRFEEGPPLDELRRRLATIAYLRTLHGDVDEAVGD
jgi:molecular chaperone HscB